MNGQGLKKNEVIITVKKVCVKGAMVKAHNKYLRDFGKPPFKMIVRINELRTYRKVEVDQEESTNSIEQQCISVQAELIDNQISTIEDGKYFIFRNRRY